MGFTLRFIKFYCKKAKLILNFDCCCLQMNKAYSIAELLKISSDRNVVQFCKDWIAGKEEFIFYSSGSTGSPKPITLTRAQMRASAQCTIQTFGLKKGNSAFLCLSVNFIAGAMLLVRCMEANMKVQILNPTTDFKDLRYQDKFALASFVPMQIQSLLKTSRGISFLNTIDNILIGGAPINSSLQSEIQQLHGHVFQVFSMTETASHFAISDLKASVHDKEQVYTVMSPVRIATDEQDCLRVCGAVSNHKWIATRDKVRLLNEKQFVWLGRMDWTINSGGIKIGLENLERKIQDILQKHDIKTPIALGASNCERLGQKVVMYVAGYLDEKKILVLLASLLPRYHVPKSIVTLNELPKTSTGKLRRKVLFQ